MNARNFQIILCTLPFLVFVTSSAREQVYYLSMEHINITYKNPDFFEFINATSARHGRWDPIHYISLHGRTLKILDSNTTVDILFYEYRSNEYRRGFVEMHLKFCDLIMKDNFFGPTLRTNIQFCPLPPGDYNWRNMSIPNLPLLRTFPFRKGRMYVTATFRNSQLVGTGYVDIEIKIKPTRPAKSYNSTKKSRNSTRPQPN